MSDNWSDDGPCTCPNCGGVWPWDCFEVAGMEYDEVMCPKGCIVKASKCRDSEPTLFDAAKETT